MTLLERLFDTRFDESPPTPAVPRPAMSVVETSDDFGKFAIEPLPRGRGMTLGNSLRRTLLNSVPGAAVTWAKIEGVPHEYASLAGMREDVTDFLLNLKGVRIRSLANGRDGCGSRLMEKVRCARAISWRPPTSRSSTRSTILRRLTRGKPGYRLS